MEGSSHSRSYSHSRSHSRAQVFSGPPPAATFSGTKKPPLFPSNGGNGAFFTTSYDDVFGGPPTFATLAPRAEDYPEIFGAFRSSSSSRASSIPVLDLPAVADVDSAASFLDYSEVFGGFDAVDFAVPYDELFRPFEAGDCSSDEAWTPVGSESLSDDSDPFAFSEKSPCFSDGNSLQSFDNKQFNVSYHKVNPGASTSVPNVTHVAQLNLVPGYSRLVDEPTSLVDMGKESLCSTTDDDVVLSVDSSSVMSQKHINQIMSNMSHAAAATLRSFDGDRRSGRAPSAIMSNVNSTFTSMSDINPRTEPSHLPPPFRPPPVPAERKGDLTKLKPDPKGSENCGLETALDGSIPLFDMEVDANSSAAVSAAAMKDAMERAQAKLKAAKVLMDRKDSLQNGENLGLETDVNGGERVQMVHDECVSKDERLSAAGYRAPAKFKSSGHDRDAKNVSQSLPHDSVVEQHTGVTGKPAERKNGRKCSSLGDTAFTGGAGEWKEATQYYEFVNNERASLTSQWLTNDAGKTTAHKQQDIDDKKNSDSADEACVPEESRRRLKATKAVSRQEYYQKMVKVAQEVHDTTIGRHAETERGRGGVPQVHLKQQKGKLVKNERQALQVDEEKVQESIRMQDDDIILKKALEKEELKQKENESCLRERNDRNRNAPHRNRVQEVFESKDEERRMRGSCEWEDSERRAQESVFRGENEQRAKETCERQREEKPAGTPKQEDNGSLEKNKRSRKAFDVGFGGEVLQTACESQENDMMKDLLLRKVKDNVKKEAFGSVVDAEGQHTTCRSHQRKVDKIPEEALEDIFNGDRPQGASESPENVKTKGSQQRDESENHAEDAVDGQGTQKTLKEAVEMEKGRKYKEVVEQENIIQRLDEVQKLEVDSKESEENQKQETSEARLERLAKEGLVESELMQTGELEETYKTPNTSYNENQKTVHTSQVKIDQVDEDHASDTSPEIEFSIKDGHLKLPTGAKVDEKDIELDNVTCKPKKPQMEAHGSLEVLAEEDNGDTSTVPSDEESKLEAVETTDVLIDERLMKPTVSEVGTSDNEHKRTIHAPDTLHTKYSNTTSDGACNGKGQTLNHEKKKVTSSVSDPKMATDFKIEQEEKRNVLGEGQVPYADEEKIRSTPGEGINGWNEQSRKKEKEAACPAMPERKEGIQKGSELPGGNQSTERKAKIIMEEKNKEKERDLEQEQLRKIEEEKEREREREKDRMAVEIAIREACERAYADARDRAERAAPERATDEARQRAMAEARERLEKACAEARERSLANKASEARLRVERAAVERATAEARQRAIEKAMAERVTLEARERMQRSVSEKYSCEREVVMRQSSMPSMSGRPEADEGEPAQRCKARLERHRRTVERVAQALAEKNMRDLLAQREQAERTRFAETLDADIKRWSSGKEGNLRALLSTLQYILGPDSGWQPIPLTEVITAAAVKKAYRKATLCVHPDKLQQRGATIQQKYICEKVFDLLKEAWNRFNSEEK